MPTASIFKNKRSGVYYIQYTEKGIRKQKSTRKQKKDEAYVVLKDFIIRPDRQRPTEITLLLFREEYKKFSEGYHTLSTQSAVVDGFRWFEMIISNRILTSITLRDIDQFITHLKLKTSIHTARKHYITLAAAFQKAVEWGYLTENLWRKVKRPKPPQVDAPFITLDDFKKIVEKICHSETRTIVTVAFNTGMRRGELIGLRWSSIDFTNRLITIQNTDTFTTKNKKQRLIPMNEECLSTLREHWKNRKDEVLVFTVLPDMVQHQFKRACSAVFGKQTKLHFHSLRHSFCSNLIRRGADIRVVQSLAGHSSLVVTEKYTHSLGSDAINAVNLLN